MSGDAPGRLVVIATPIGNLGDLTERAKALLGEVDVLCCEDTRVTGKLLNLIGIAAPKLVSLHEHNEHDRTPEIIDRIGGGETVGLVCDAGTPLLSDPGARLVQAVIAAGLVVTTAPGASAALGAIVLSGFDVAHFRFEGFLPKKGGDRSQRLAHVARATEPTVIYEAPSRVRSTLADLAAVCGDVRKVAIVRELTKLHEEVWRGPLGAATEASAATVARGEYVLVVDGSPNEPSEEIELAPIVAQLAAAGLRRRDAVVALETLAAVPHRAAYEAVLAEAGFARDE